MSKTLLREAIPNLVRGFDEGLGDDFSGPAHLLRFEVTEEGVDFGFLTLKPGQHPLDVLIGFVAPEEWAAFGAVSHGWATQTGTAIRPSLARDRVRIRGIHVASRDGTEVGGFRLAGDELRLQEQAIGMIPDALRRAVGLATPPPEHPPAELTAADWLDAVADGRASAEDPPAPPTSWEDIRWAVITGRRVVPELSAIDAAWMDTGMFARWMTSTYPRTADHLAAVRRVVDAKVYRALRTTLKEWSVLT